LAQRIAPTKLDLLLIFVSSAHG